MVSVKADPIAEARAGIDHMGALMLAVIGFDHVLDGGGEQRGLRLVFSSLGGGGCLTLSGGAWREPKPNWAEYLHMRGVFETRHWPDLVSAQQLRAEVVAVKQQLGSFRPVAQQWAEQRGRPLPKNGTQLCSPSRGSYPY